MDSNVQELAIPTDQPSEDANLPHPIATASVHARAAPPSPKKTQPKKQQPAVTKLKKGGQMGKNGKGKTPGKHKLANNNIIPL